MGREAKESYANDQKKVEAEFFAYKKDLDEGKLEQLRGQFVAYYGGKMLGYATTKKGLMEKLSDKKVGYLIQQVGVEPPVVNFRHRPRASEIFGSEVTGF